tara:strand:+ start:14205 stop:14477 length:273 start_codon:yes stop_codon:yes gene_type:complete
VKVIQLNRAKKQALANDEKCQLVEQLYAEYGSAMRRFIRVRSRLSEGDCEDVMQEVYERLLKLEDLQQNSLLNKAKIIFRTRNISVKVTS